VTYMRERQVAVSLVVVARGFVRAAHLPATLVTGPFRLAVFTCACLDQSAFLAIIIVARLHWLSGASVAITRISHLVASVAFARIDCLVFCIAFFSRARGD